MSAIPAESDNPIRLLLKRDWDFTSEVRNNDGIYSLHPYPAKFIPNIPQSLIDDLRVPENTLVFDPFCGYGTTLIAAQEKGYSSIGIDLNPIACLISRVTTRHLPKDLVITAKKCILQAINSHELFPHTDIPNIDHWFKKHIQIAIAKLIFQINKTQDEVPREALQLALSSIIVRISNQDSDTRYAAVEKDVSDSDVYSLFEKACERIELSLKNTETSLPPATVLNKDILTVTKSDFSAPVGLVVCSPPYPNAYEYWLYHKYRMWWLGFDPLYVKEREIGARPHFFKKNPQGPEDFKKQMLQVFQLLSQVCAPDAYVCFVLGDSKIHGKIINNTKILIESAAANGFVVKAVLPRSIASSRKSFNLSHARIQNENIIVFQQRRLRQKKTYEIDLVWHKYRYFPYERKFALREISGISGLDSIIVNQDKVTLQVHEPRIDDFSRLVYFENYNAHDLFQGKTKQSLIEKAVTSNGNGKRQSTRYSVHGIHEYKGRFNPQIVRGIINSFELDEQSQIIDPFLGSGTTLIESIFAGHQAYGWDLNPFAVYLTNAKLLALSAHPSNIKKISEKINNKIQGCKNKIDKNDPRFEYLQKWFPKETLYDIENMRAIINEVAGEYGSIFKIVLSNLLREYSLQEPSDLRIRRRKTPLPANHIILSYKEAIQKLINSLTYTSKIFPNLEPSAKAVQADGRFYDDVNEKLLTKINASLAITSPPYATALPYIDTQRLSLVWLDLISPNSIKIAERNLIGSREASSVEFLKLVENINDNTSKLPESIVKFCTKLQNQLIETDGFRRKAVPGLLYRYFSDMKQTFLTVRKLMENGGNYVLIVGTNRTTIGGKTEIIDTPYYLTELARSHGWNVLEKLDLETYRRYGLHASNSIRDESMLVFQK
ncbi:MAG: DNA methyltransferase [Candidatus Hodarchaeota archaeon]